MNGEVREAAASLTKDLVPGPFQPIGGWAHAIPTAKREAIVTVLRALAQAPAPPAPPVVPEGLCGDKVDHAPHRVEYAAVAGGPMNCHGDQSRRMPWAAEQAQRRAAAQRI